MKKWLDEQILQSYFDGELDSAVRERVSSHLAVCGSCAEAARQLEGENLLLSQALAPEFEVIVPSDQLRRRIDAAVAQFQAGKPNHTVASTFGHARWFASLSRLFTFTPQRAIGYAAVVIILLFAAVVGFVRLRNAPDVPARDGVAGTHNQVLPGGLLSDVPARLSPTDKPTLLVPQKVSYLPKRQQRQGAPDTVNKVKLLPGERSYLKSIASLDRTIKSANERPMRPALRAEYERNLALVDRAIAATRSAAKSNPNDPDAAEFMFAAYQSKVNLLNTVADARFNNRQR